ncbi:hypothetical protein EC9_38940 [Rosistilla ulvae]|uniref:Uncharacterized protein n=1 Tax=Rosistilla ulvae TaxID=1930277 RepID=A0A517M4A6_9BACT|nr:hypothetical protein [Rosistilla ulvae]QDS89694.1 hypothetical protein EC9_38940 [Rosistilla ulvae]
MPDHIKERKVNGQCVAWVENPINPSENFADRWQAEDYPDRETNFRDWLKQVGVELEEALKGGGIHRVLDLLGESLGRKVVEASAKSLGYDVQRASSSGKLAVTSSTATLITGTAPMLNTTPVRGHTFYGDSKRNK